MSTEKSRPGAHSSREPAGDVWRHTLARIPTLFGRLIYLASLRSRGEGGYVHPGLAQMVGEENALDMLRRSHTRLFQDWLCLDLERQKADLQEYLAELPNPGEVLAAWVKSGSYRDLTPPSAEDMERRLFISDLETLLALLKVDYGSRSSGPGA